ncbi:hypothetical protein Tco_1223293, partial [Tanacetum coccineum]
MVAVAVGWWKRRVGESGSGDRVHRVVGSNFGLRRKSPPEKFSGGGATVAGGGEGSPEKKVERERKYESVCVL